MARRFLGDAMLVSEEAKELQGEMGFCRVSRELQGGKSRWIFNALVGVSIRKR